MAAFRESYRMAKLLLEQPEINVNLAIKERPTNETWEPLNMLSEGTPLTYAIWHQSVHVVRLLVQVLAFLLEDFFLNWGSFSIAEEKYYDRRESKISAP